jgi:hypothetical protein
LKEKQKKQTILKKTTLKNLFWANYLEQTVFEKADLDQITFVKTDCLLTLKLRRN